MPLTVKYSEKYNDALIALATVTHRPANIVNIADDYAIRVDLEYNRYAIATNTLRGLSDDPDANGTWLVRFFQSSTDVEQDQLLAEATHQWLIDAFDCALERLEAKGNTIVADADFGDISRSDTSPPADVSGLGNQG
ncbi:hypothetical protein [Rhodococcus sp. ARC_M6]|uniref:hypothetical protein n=1 Tax=Rhodococcus sp. ARC_M6 TaxID=2928852 RepID=UPI001FB4CBAC|nr:hypothetical protein [Rhodococcus sp. ARC_M6]MCJ0906341.1 hypothetical protein [Rhodococcus sp. ARC_M6]